jgi:hypothetical protein
MKTQILRAAYGPLSNIFQCPFLVLELTHYLQQHQKAGSWCMVRACLKEDHVSMGMTSALKLRQIVENAEGVLAIELLAAAERLDFRSPLKSSRPIERARASGAKAISSRQRRPVTDSGHGENCQRNPTGRV